MSPVDSNPSLGKPNISSVVCVNCFLLCKKNTKEIVRKILGKIRFVYKSYLTLSNISNYRGKKTKHHNKTQFPFYSCFKVRQEWLLTHTTKFKPCVSINFSIHCGFHWHNCSEWTKQMKVVIEYTDKKIKVSYI